MYTELIDSLLERATEMVPGITPGELAIAAAAWLRIHLDGEPEARVISWARKTLGFESSTSDILRMHADGASVRRIAAVTGISKSKVARVVSQGPTLNR